MIKPFLPAAIIAALSLSAMSLSACSDATDTAKTATAIVLPALLNPNTASSDDLRAVAGMTDTLLLDIEAARPFTDGAAFADFVQSRSSDPEALLNAVFVPFPINSTPEADFKSIPGVGDKMAHEFEEYRPYSDMAQFDREIGKYVDADELARLRRFIVID